MEPDTITDNTPQWTREPEATQTPAHSFSYCLRVGERMA